MSRMLLLYSADHNGLILLECLHGKRRLIENRQKFQYSSSFQQVSMFIQAFQQDETIVVCWAAYWLTQRLTELPKGRMCTCLACSIAEGSSSCCVHSSLHDVCSLLQICIRPAFGHTACHIRTRSGTTIWSHSLSYTHKVCDRTALDNARGRQLPQLSIQVF